MVELHPIGQFLGGVAAVGVTLGIVGLALDVVLRKRIEERIHELLLEVSALGWGTGAMGVVVFVSWVFIVQGELFQAAMFGLVAGLVLAIFVLFVYPEAAAMMEESDETTDTLEPSE